MPFVERLGRTQPEPDAVEAERVVCPHALEHVPVVAARAEVVLAVDLDPADRGPGLQEVAVVPGAQPDPGAEAKRRGARGADCAHPRLQLFFSLAFMPGSPCLRLPPICAQVPAFTALKSFGS